MRLGLALLAAVASTIAAAEPPPASPLLPPDHWAVAAARRLYEVGLAPEWMPAQRAAPLAVVGETLERAAQRATTEAPAYAPLARAWLARFHEEFRRMPTTPTSGGAAETIPTITSARAGGGYQDGWVHELAGAASPSPSALHLSVPPADPFLELGGTVAYGPHLAGAVSARATPWDVAVPSFEVVGALGPFALSVGKAPVGYGPGEVGGIVATGNVAIDRAELMTTAPVRLPGPLDVLGDWALDVTLARFDEARHPYHPLLWEFDVQWRPHPRLTFGAMRGFMFGGPFWDGISVRDAVLGLVGVSNKAPGNNVYSVSGEYRLPTEALLPLTARIEWGTDDNPGAAVTWPGLVAGLTAPMLPGLPAALGFEYAYFGRGPFGYHDPFGWYSHGQYVGGWATDESPLGDPLGGNGRAFRLVGSADPWDGLLRLTAVAFVQDRFLDNLYAPQAGGRSVGARGTVELRLGRTAIGVSGGYERGRDGWYGGDLEARATLFL